MRPVGLLPLVMAIAGPAALIGAAWVSLMHPEPWSANEAVTRMDRELAARPFSTVVTGSSFARSDIDVAVLEKALGFDPARVVNLPVNGAPPPVWYALLKYRVFEAGHRPDLVMIVATMASITSIRPNPARMEDLVEHFAEPDETVRRLTFDAAGPAWIERPLERRGSLRAAILEPFRWGIADLLLTEPGGPDAAHLVADAGDQVFGAQHAGERFLAPGGRVETTTEDDRPWGDPVDDPRDGYLPPLAAMAHQAGTRLVIVLPPTVARAQFGQALDPAAEQRYVALANELGIGWLDMRSLVYAEEDFVDGRHMRPPAAKRFTAELARRLQAIGATTPGAALRPAAALQPAAVERVGGDAPPQLGVIIAQPLPCQETIELVDGAPLAEDQVLRLPGRHHSPLEVLEDGVLLPQVSTSADLGTGCTGRVWHDRGRIHVRRVDRGGAPIELRLAGGLPVRNGGGEDAWWIWPGTDLRWAYSEPPDADARTLRVDVAVLAVSAESERPSLRVGESTVELTPVGHELHASIEVPAPTGPWAIELESPSGSAYAEVLSLRWAAGALDQDIVARRSTRWVDLLVGSAVTAAPPPAVEVVPQVSPRGAWIAAPWTNKLGCTPLRLTDDGVPVAHASPDVTVGPPPRTGFAHIFDKIWFLPAADWASHHFTLGLEPDRLCWARGCRICGERLWLYPGDDVVVRLSADTRRNQDLRLRTLRMPGETGDGSAAEAPIDLELTVGGVSRMSVRATLAELNAGRLLTVTPPLLREYGAKVVLRLHNPPENPAILLQAWGGADPAPQN